MKQTATDSRVTKNKWVISIIEVQLKNTKKGGKTTTNKLKNLDNSSPNHFPLENSYIFDLLVARCVMSLLYKTLISSLLSTRSKRKTSAYARGRPWDNWCLENYNFEFFMHDGHQFACLCINWSDLTRALLFGFEIYFILSFSKIIGTWLIEHELTHHQSFPGTDCHCSHRRQWKVFWHPGTWNQGSFAGSPGLSKTFLRLDVSCRCLPSCCPRPTCPQTCLSNDARGEYICVHVSCQTSTRVWVKTPNSVENQRRK